VRDRREKSETGSGYSAANQGIHPSLLSRIEVLSGRGIAFAIGSLLDSAFGDSAASPLKTPTASKACSTSGVLATWRVFLGRFAKLPASRRNDRFEASILSVAARQMSRDRKSTRLNSSHVKISYAVFCLKKKKQHSNRPARMG